MIDIKVSATLAANEAVAERRRQGLPALPMGFGEAGLPVHASLRQKLRDGAGHNGYGSVSGSRELRTAVAGYWARRGLPTSADNIVCGPGSKPLLYSLMMAIGGDIAVPVPSWVSYAAQAQIVGAKPLLIPTLPGEGGVPDPELLAKAIDEARTSGRDVRSVIVTLPDNPTGTIASEETVRQLCAVAKAKDLIIISDEIYRDLVFDPARKLVSPAEIAPERTITTTGLSKNLALGGWRLGAARLPESEQGQQILTRLKGIASEIWSSPSSPVQHAAAFAFSEPAELAERIALSRRLHAKVAHAVAERFRAAGASVAQPQGAFYLYPDFDSWRSHLAETHSLATGVDLSQHFLHEHGLAILPGSEFGESPEALRFRVATSMLYGETETERETALTATDPLQLPWIQSSLEQLETILDAVLSDAAADYPTEEVVRQVVQEPLLKQ